jgi:hypothetical protein
MKDFVRVTMFCPFRAFLKIKLSTFMVMARTNNRAAFLVFIEEMNAI